MPKTSMGPIAEGKQKKQLQLFCAGQLKSAVCQCGRNKQRGMAVCYSCWKLLDMPMRHSLYNALGRGFEQALKDAYQALADVPHRCAAAPVWPE